MHTNYQIDGNTNTEKDRAGLRLLPISEVLVREVKVDHQRASRPSSARRPAWSTTRSRRRAPTTCAGYGELPLPAQRDVDERPFFLSPDRAQARHRRRRRHRHAGRADREGQVALLPRATSTWTATCRAAPRSSSRAPSTTRRRSACRRPRSRRTASSPPQQKVNFAFGKIDYQLIAEHKLSARYFFFKNLSPYNIGGGLNTVDRATDFTDRMDSASVQLISTFGGEPPERAARPVRAAPPVPHRERERGRRPGDHRRAASRNFGGPLDAAPRRRLRLQPEDLAGHRQLHLDRRARTASRPASTCSSSPTTACNTLRADLHLPDASTPTSRRRAGANPFGYTTFQQDLGDLTRQLQLGLLRLLRAGRLAAQLAHQAALRRSATTCSTCRLRGRSRPTRYSQNFTIDKNNFAPRVGLLVVRSTDGADGAARVDRASCTSRRCSTSTTTRS